MRISQSSIDGGYVCLTSASLNYISVGRNDTAVSYSSNLESNQHLHLRSASLSFLSLVPCLWMMVVEVGEGSDKQCTDGILSATSSETKRMIRIRSRAARTQAATTSIETMTQLLLLKLLSRTEQSEHSTNLLLLQLHFQVTSMSP